MMNKYRLHPSTPEYLRRVRMHHCPYDVEVFGRSLRVCPGVMSPQYGWSGGFHVECLPALDGCRVLDVGCGCGIIAVFAGLRNAEVMAIDVNSTAVANTHMNFERHRVSGRCRALMSDLFENVGGAFDFIVFNLPYHGCCPSDMLERGVADENYETQARFFQQVGHFLANEGRIHCGFSTSGDQEVFTRNVRRNGFVIRKTWSDDRNGYNCEVHELVRDSCVTDFVPFNQNSSGREAL